MMFISGLVGDQFFLSWFSGVSVQMAFLGGRRACLPFTRCARDDDVILCPTP